MGGRFGGKSGVCDGRGRGGSGRGHGDGMPNKQSLGMASSGIDKHPI